MTSVSDQPSPNVVLGTAFFEAVRWASELHAEQARKSTTIPYVSHLLGVASLVLEVGGDETEAVAAMLHDALEDQDVTLEEVEQHHGPRVAALVKACTDDLPDESDAGSTRDASNWRNRKEHYLAHLARETDPGVLRVSGADKLHNARAIVTDLRLSPDAWSRFNAPPEDQLWYYGELVKVLAPRLPEHLRVELEATVATMLELTDLPSASAAWQAERDV